MCFQVERKSLPTDCVIAVTYLCNSRCVMCNFWQETRPPTVTLDDYRKLPATLRDINISGGEPFLRADLVEVVRVLRAACPKAQIIISTNGFLTQRILEQTGEILKFYPRIGLRVSIDGVGEMHERIRRLPLAFEKCLLTLRSLKKLGVKNLGIAYTMSGDNAEHFVKVYELARQEGVQLTSAVAQSSYFYFGGKQIEQHLSSQAVARAFDQVIKRELGRWSPKAWARAYFTYGLKCLALDNIQLLPSRPGVDFFFLDPFGRVYPSVVHDHVMGSFSTAKNFQELWLSSAAEKARSMAQKSGRPVWMVCTARTAMKRHPLRVIFWILANWIRAAR